MVDPVQLTGYCPIYGEVLTVCERGDHDFAEGDEGAVYCTVCTGYRCSVCGGTGSAHNNRGCWCCSKWGVEMWFEPEQRLLNPVNWAAASAPHPSSPTPANQQAEGGSDVG